MILLVSVMFLLWWAVATLGSGPDVVITDVESVKFGRGTVVVVAVERSAGDGGSEQQYRSVVLRMTERAVRKMAFLLQDYVDQKDE